jgi:proteic killer suppression protein
MLTAAVLILCWLSPCCAGQTEIDQLLVSRYIRQKVLDSCNLQGYTSVMIKSFKHKGLKEFFYSGKKKGIRPEQASRLSLILDRLNAASDVKDMNYPGSFLHKLSGQLKDHYSVRVSGNWRVFFEFKDGDAYIVNYDDYH